MSKTNVDALKTLQEKISLSEFPAGKERVEKQKERLRTRSVMALLGQAMSKAMIATVLEMTVEEINAIEAKYKGKNPFTIPLNGNSKN